MADVFSKAKRSEVMSRIRSRGNKDTELALAKLFRRHKVTGWRRQLEIAAAVGDRRHSAGAHRAPLPRPALRVRPDFVFPQARLAVFVDGCFWHGCPRHGTRPRSNAKFWRSKIARNQSRDRTVTRVLRKTGWKVLRIWEHELARKNEGRLWHRMRQHFAHP
jgi:DNA mismatch endonuclease (patch repair protein)